MGLLVLIIPNRKGGERNTLDIVIFAATVAKHSIKQEEIVATMDIQVAKQRHFAAQTFTSWVIYSEAIKREATKVTFGHNVACPICLSFLYAVSVGHLKPEWGWGRLTRSFGRTSISFSTGIPKSNSAYCDFGNINRGAVTPLRKHDSVTLRTTVKFCSSSSSRRSSSSTASIISSRPSGATTSPRSPGTVGSSDTARFGANYLVVITVLVRFAETLTSTVLIIEYPTL